MYFHFNFSDFKTNRSEIKKIWFFDCAFFYNARILRKFERNYFQHCCWERRGLPLMGRRMTYGICSPTVWHCLARQPRGGWHGIHVISRTRHSRYYLLWENDTVGGLDELLLLLLFVSVTGFCCFFFQLFALNFYVFSLIISPNLFDMPKLKWPSFYSRMH